MRPSEASLHRRWRSICRVAAVILAHVSMILAVGACAEGAPEPRPPDRPLAAYVGRPAELFDDAIELSAVGFALEGGSPAEMSTKLRERTQSADAVVRARIVTVTSSREDAGREWQMGLRTLEGLAGTRPPADITLRIRSTDPAAGVLRASENRLVGRTLVAFVREFASPSPSEGHRPETHFHVGPDSKDELEAVHTAALLGEVR